MSRAERHFDDQQRLAFGTVAELYDRARPSYPAAVVDDVVEFAGLVPGARILDVGAGTGKATVLFAQRGFRVLALEPSPAMAAVARANCAGFPGVEIVEVEFERWSGGERLPALVSAQAWHWIAPDVRFAKAHDALSPGGTLAAIWTFPEWGRCSLRDALRDAYRNGAPQLEPEFPMHPASTPVDLAGDWEGQISRSAEFAGAAVRTYPWSLDYSPVTYTMLLETHQDHILLPAGRRDELLSAVSQAIEAGGGTITLPFETRLCVARRR